MFIGKRSPGTFDLLSPMSAGLPMENSGITAVERAFELARSGQYGSLSDIRRQLRIEGHSQEQIQGVSLLSQIRGLIKRARPGV